MLTHVCNFRKLNTAFIVFLILVLTFINNTISDILLNNNFNNNTKKFKNENFFLLNKFSDKGETNKTLTFEYLINLIEDIFIEDDNNKNNLNPDYSDLVKNLDKFYKSDENQLNFLNSNNDHYIHMIDITENNLNFFKDFCIKEKSDFSEKINSLTMQVNEIINKISIFKDYQKNLKENIAKNTKFYNQTLKRINSEKKNFYEIKNKINNIENKDTLIMLDSLGHLVNSIYEDFYSNLDKENNNQNITLNNNINLTSKFIELSNHAIKLKEYSISNFFLQILSKDILVSLFDNKIKNEIINFITKLKNKYLEMQNEKKSNLEIEVNLLNKSIENNQNIIDLVTKQSMDYKNEIIIHKNAQINYEKIKFSLIDQITKIKELKRDLDNYCL